MGESIVDYRIETPPVPAVSWKRSRGQRVVRLSMSAASMPISARRAALRWLKSRRAGHRGGVERCEVLGGGLIAGLDFDKACALFL
jgi:hypothetical protein